ncbi:glutathione S-transferase [Polynucleobacter sp. AP-Kolm-20A-A1]|uniref:glutathione S-transferase n=1 Tax=Polynucleobacter sp. AP-Kolm-20A-A1 TaxID=2081041 RepID=UPI0020415015|nr:glutathione S-transferase [Polynucleobacter sp. AP-Kolm-20A-A1]
MALRYAGIEVEHREIALRDKPQSMLLASPKGTVPVLCVDGVVLDQSLDIMYWALDKSDPNNWRAVDETAAQAWIQKNDGPFKTVLDQYKYPNRYPDLQQEETLAKAMELMLEPMETSLQKNQYLMGNCISWVDIAIFPFIRQFSKAEPLQFEGLSLPNLKKWLNQLMASDLFASAMGKYPTWID